jgi:hypothetical protein
MLSRADPMRTCQETKDDAKDVQAIPPRQSHTAVTRVAAVQVCNPEGPRTENSAGQPHSCTDTPDFHATHRNTLTSNRFYDTRFMGVHKPTPHQAKPSAIQCHPSASQRQTQCQVSVPVPNCPSAKCSLRNHTPLFFCQSDGG